MNTDEQRLSSGIHCAHSHLRWRIRTMEADRVSRAVCSSREQAGSDFTSVAEKFSCQHNRNATLIKISGDIRVTAELDVALLPVVVTQQGGLEANGVVNAAEAEGDIAWLKREQVSCCYMTREKGA